MADGFDPDKFLAEKDEFDPDAFLAKEEPKEKSTFSKAMDILDYGGRIGRTALAAPLSEEYSAGDILEQAKSLYPENAAKKAPSGSEIAKMAGVSGEKVNFNQPKTLGDFATSVGVGALAGTVAPKPLVDLYKNYLEKKGTTFQDVAGVPIEMAADATNIIPVGAIAKGGAKAVSKIPKFLGGVSSKAASKFDDVVNVAAKGIANVAGESGSLDDLDMMKIAYEGGRPKNIKEIGEASKRLNIKPTAGMISESPIVQGLESSLEQSPSIAGAMVRKETSAVRSGIQKSLAPFAEQTTGMSKIEVGDAFKRGVVESIAQRHAPLAQKFEKLRESTKFIEIPDKSKLAVANNIMNIDAVKLAPNEPWSQLAQRYSDYILNAKTADDIKSLRGIVGKQLRGSEGTEKYVLGEVYQKLVGLEERGIKSAAISQARTSKEGAEIGKQMLSELKDAKTGYRELMQSIGETADAAGLKRVETVENFLDSIQKIPSDQLTDKVFKMNDLRSLEVIEKAFPTEFSLLRKQKISEIIEKASTKGNLDPQKFVKAIKDYSPETLKKVFGGDVNQVLQDVKTVMDSFPNMMGPSGTPQGNMFIELLKPFFQTQEAARYALYKRLKNPVKPIEQVKSAQKLMTEAPKQSFKENALKFAGDMVDEQKYKSLTNLMTQWERSKGKPVTQDQAAEMYLRQGNGR